MNLFKFTVMLFFAVFCMVSVLFAQVSVTDETGFSAEMLGAGPNISVSSSIYFTQPFQNTINKNVTVSLNSGIILDGSNIPSLGQGFNFSGSTLTLNYGASNAVSGFSGAFTATSGSLLNFNGNNITIRQNSNQTSDGGAFSLSGASAASFTSSNILFSRNTSTGNGGAVFVTGNSSFDITASTILFRNNSAAVSAGGIYSANGSTVSLNGSFIDFSGNIGKLNGGALHGGNGSYFNIAADTVFFEDNLSDGPNGAGGVAYAENANFDFGGRNVYFYSNQSSGNGGALFARDNSAFNFNATTHTFAGNESGLRGGAIYSESGSDFMFNGNYTCFDVNKSLTFGGAIDAVGGSEFTFSSMDTCFNYNESGDGGAIHGDDAVLTFNGDEILFASNKAIRGGGALYAENNAVFDIVAANTLFRNNSASNGGAVYMAYSSITIDNAKFLNNSASAQGGAIYMDGLSASAAADLKINALTEDVLFDGNAASGKANDIYMNKYGNIEFYADSGRTITLEGGIEANGDLDNTIIKSGTGTLEFAGNYSDYKGGLKVSAGTLTVKNDTALTAGNFEVESGAVYSTVNNQSNQKTTVGSAQINGEINIDVDFASYKADKIISASGITSAADGKVNLDSSSVLNITSAGTLGIGTSRITLIEAENGIAGIFSSDNFASVSSLFPAGTTAIIEYLANRVDLYVSKTSSFHAVMKMTHNQKEVALALDETSKANTTAAMSDLLTKADALANDSLKRSAFDQLSGSFIANALTAGALRNGMTELYERMQPRYCPHDAKISESLWGQLYLSNNKYDGDENSVEDFNINGYGIQAGFDLLTWQSALSGFYVSYGNDTLEQGYDKADMQDYSLGFYGGWFGETFDVKASLSGGMQSFDLKRNIKFAGLKTNADFNTYSVRADGQIEFKISLGNLSALELRPFIGLQGGYVMNDKIEEENGGAANLIVESGDYMRMTGLGGVAIGNRSDKFSWYGKLYAGYLIAGTQNEIDAKIENYDEKMNIYGTETGAFGGGAGIGAEYNLNKQWSLYANANAGLSDGASAYYGNVGINYSFCSEASKVGNIYSKEESKPVKKEESFVPLESATQEEKKPESVAAEPYVEPVKADDNKTFTYTEPSAQETYSYPETAKVPVEQEAYVKAEEVKPVPAKTEPLSELKPVFQKTASFVSDNHELGDAEKDTIRQQAEELKKKGYKKIVVRGHTDSTGDEAANNTLSLQRAKAVYEELIANGIDPERIEYVGYADRKPAASNATEEGMALNRRTDIVVDEPTITPGVIYTASYFMTDASNLPASVKAKIKEQSDEIKQINYSEIKIEGHADSTGNDAINNPLSKQRAKTIYDEFIRNGIPSGNMAYTGYGSGRPIDTNTTREGRANNRRVEVTVK